MATTSQRLIEELEMNYGLIQSQMKGLGHFDTLLQLPFRGNCANWVLGHIVEGRNDMLKFLGLIPLWDDAACALYRSGSAAITSSESPHLSLECLMMDLKAMHNLLLETLAQSSQEQLDSPTAHPDDGSLGNLMARMTWHETYHLGQLELLRQLAGKEDAVF